MTPAMALATTMATATATATGRDTTTPDAGSSVPGVEKRG
ncbi:hypothetical protein GA0111570_102341 [Raineyella antarctica]|uniref:Uncharacterized protein n=1 Tax=Raineyella antarctica TaxID=1577474 RepID=A0A1G6GF06_9ACTN|nr:hypothetical protein GA0111570_102341 [Raineyella antarctica]